VSPAPVEAVASPAPVKAVAVVSAPAPVEAVVAEAPVVPNKASASDTLLPRKASASDTLLPRKASASDTLLPRKASAPPVKPVEVVSVLRLMSRATLLRKQDRPLLSLEVYREVLNRDEGNLAAELGIGWCLFDLRRYGESREVFDSVVARSPRSSDAHIGLAEIHRLKGRVELARKHFNEYLRIEPRGEGVPMVKAMLKGLK